MRTDRYENLNAVRTVSSVMIVLMHVMVNGGFIVPDNMLFTLVGRAGALVEMFFILSAFSMCCGYFEKMKNGTMLPKEFYLRRFGKFAPFFWMITAAYTVPMAVKAISVKESLDRIAEEAFFNISLLFGFLPDNRMDVAGIGWTLGVIFAFYLLFPFFVCITEDKRKTTASFALFLAVNSVMIHYYSGTGRFLKGNILYQMCFFALGAFLYHFRKPLRSAVNAVPCMEWLCIISGTVISMVLMPEDIFVRNVAYMMGFGLIITGCLGKENRVFSNAVMRIGAEYSFELYLSHMLVFTAVNAAVKKITPDRSLLTYLITAAATLAGAYVFSAAAKKALQKTLQAYGSRGSKKEKKFEDTSRQ